VGLEDLSDGNGELVFQYVPEMGLSIPTGPIKVGVEEEKKNCPEEKPYFDLGEERGFEDLLILYLLKPEPIDIKFKEVTQRDKNKEKYRKENDHFSKKGIHCFLLPGLFR
jgi:hypothetical protein